MCNNVCKKYFLILHIPLLKTQENEQINFSSMLVLEDPKKSLTKTQTHIITLQNAFDEKLLKELFYIQ